MQLPKSIQNVIESFERLPGIGPKTAQRLTYYLLHAPKSESEMLARSIQELKEKTVLCSECLNISETNPCQICSSIHRDKTIICIVEEPLDVIAIEKSNSYKGLYHVLHGSISPMNNIGPDELYIKELLPRLKNEEIQEIILATNPTMEGEATAMYIQRLIKPLNIRITRIARGLPVGGDLEYADEVTLSRALEGRCEY